MNPHHESPAPAPSSAEKNIILRDELPLKQGPISIAEATEALSSLDDYARMEIGVNAMGPRQVLERFILETATAREEACRVSAST